jgi:SAM-dependent methyltransferase
MVSDPYRNPGLYDLEYADLAEDVAWYRAIGARRGGPVLELGVGNGRIAIPLARDGVEVHGVDRSADMLSDLARKLADEPPDVRARVRVAMKDFRALEGPPRYGTVYLPFNAIHHLDGHRDVLELFEAVRRVLLPDGRFFLDCYLPDPELFGRDASARYGETEFSDPGSGERITSWEQSWYDPLEQIHHVVYTYQYPDGQAETVRLDLRVFYPRELLALVDLGGFDVVDAFGGFAREPIRASTTKWVAELAPRG